MDKHQVVTAIRQGRVLLVLDGPPEELLSYARSAATEGVRLLEVESGERASALRLLAAELPDCLLGAGGIRSAHEAWEAVEAGAKFLSAAPFSAEIAAVCEAATVATIAAVATPEGAEEAITLRPDFIRCSPKLAAGLGLRPDAPDLLLELPGPINYSQQGNTVVVRARGAVASLVDTGRGLGRLAGAEEVES